MGSRKLKLKVTFQLLKLSSLFLCVLTAFREVFNLFDINGGGTIDAGELDSALQSVEVQLTHQEIHDVLQVIDEDGTY